VPIRMQSLNFNLTFFHQGSAHTELWPFRCRCYVTESVTFLSWLGKLHSVSQVLDQPEGKRGLDKKTWRHARRRSDKRDVEKGKQT
jgi:hypothetical protein